MLTASLASDHNTSADASVGIGSIYSDSSGKLAVVGRTMAYPTGLSGAMWYHHRSQQYDGRTRKPLINLGDFS